MGTMALEPYMGRVMQGSFLDKSGVYKRLVLYIQKIHILVSMLSVGWKNNSLMVCFITMVGSEGLVYPLTLTLGR
jgi:hypothetical protein